MTNQILKMSLVSSHRHPSESCLVIYSYSRYLHYYRSRKVVVDRFVYIIMQPVISLLNRRSQRHNQPGYRKSLLLHHTQTPLKAVLAQQNDLFPQVLLTVMMIGITSRWGCILVVHPTKSCHPRSPKKLKKHDSKSVVDINDHYASMHFLCCQLLTDIASRKNQNDKK